jgi:hypothetical protein
VLAVIRVVDAAASLMKAMPFCKFQYSVGFRRLWMRVDGLCIFPKAI